jgi:predicted phage terminase large subunit-like protein
MHEDYVFTLKDIEAASEEERNIYRYACQTDLFWLANCVLRSPRAKPLLPAVHGGICETLIQKYPTSNLAYTSGYEPAIVKPLEEWSPVKERVILSSRGTLKSTLEAADIVQIILCEPNVRIILMSGKIGLAKSILRMARGYFESNDVIQALFPQFCDGIKINANEFTSPARHDVNYRDPTLQIATFGSVKAGIHGEYIKLDDATNEINQATPELIEKSIAQYDDLDPLLEPGGYVDFTGTRWAVDDLPEYIRVKGEEMESETGRKHVLYFFQPIWKVKKVEDPLLSPVQLAKLQNERDEREKKHLLVPNDVDLLWPEKLTSEYLWPKYRKNPSNFAKQYLLNPESVITGCFTHSLLVRQTRPISECPMPHRSITVINWDLAGISGKGDFAVGVAGIWEDTGRLYIIDAIVEKFRSSTDICNAIIRFFMKYNPDFHRIESANGSQLLSGELRRIAEEADLERTFFPGWEPPINEESAKTTRIMLLPGALENDKLQFFSGIPDLQELYKQFEKFTGKGKYKDDGPDCIAQMYQKWKGSISPKSIAYVTPSGAVVDFQSDLPVSESKDIDIHADERMNADIDFLSGFTVPHTGL